MATYLAETGINVFQHFQSQTPSNVQSELQPVVIGPLYQMKYNEPVTVTDMKIYAGTAGVFDVITGKLEDPNMPTNITTLHKLVISAPSTLAGSYNIKAVDHNAHTLTIEGTTVVPTSGSNGIEFFVYDPNKNYSGYGMKLGYPGLLSFSDTSKNPEVDRSSVVVKINDINGDHVIPTAVVKATVAGADMVNANGSIKIVLKPSDNINTVTTSQSILVSEPAELSGFYRIASINTVEETTNIAMTAASTLANEDFFVISDANGATHAIWYKIGSTGNAPSGYDTTVEVAISDTDTAAQVATATKAAIVAALGQQFTVTGTDANMVLKTTAFGAVADFQDGPAEHATGFTAQVSAQGEKSITVIPENVTVAAGSHDNISFMALTPGKTTGTIGILLTPGIAYKGPVKVSYRALRKDLLYQLIRFQYVSDMRAEFGDNLNDPNNTLAFGMAMEMQGAGQRVEVMGIPIAADNADEHARAIETLHLRKEAYYVVPLTQEPAYLQLYENHVLTVSDPYERWEAVALINRALPTASVAFERGGYNGPALSGADNFGFKAVSGQTGKYEFTDDTPGNDFSTLGVTTNYKLRMTVVVNGVASTITCPVVDPVPSVALRNKITFSTSGASMGDFVFPTDLSTVQIYKYMIISELFETESPSDKTRQAIEITQWIKSKSLSIADSGTAQSSRRIWAIMPDQVIVATNEGDKVVPGYFLSAVLAGLKAALPPQQPVAEYPIPSIKKVLHSSNYFTNTQIRTMESAGCMFFYQPSEGAVPRARRQISTDLSSIKTMEISTITVVDTIAKRIRFGLCNLTGRNLLTPNLINVVRICLESYIAQAKENGMIAGGTVKDVSIDPNAQDHLIVNISLDTYDPFNVADVHLYI